MDGCLAFEDSNPPGRQVYPKTIVADASAALIAPVANSGVLLELFECSWLLHGIESGSVGGTVARPLF